MPSFKKTMKALGAASSIAPAAAYHQPVRPILKLKTAMGKIGGAGFPVHLPEINTIKAASAGAVAAVGTAAMLGATHIGLAHRQATKDSEAENLNRSTPAVGLGFGNKMTKTTTTRIRRALGEIKLAKGYR